MSRFSKEELNERISNLEGLDDDTKISLMEDISDSFLDDSMYKDLEDKYNSKVEEYDELKTKYKERFFNTDDSKDVKREERKDFEDNEVIDIRSLF